MTDNLAEKERLAIKALRTFEPQDGSGYYLCYSGGKDSDVIRILAQLAGVKHDIVHHLTTVDAPETVYYVRSIPDVIIERPPKSMWRLIAEHTIPPTRFTRYCCAALKERGGVGRLKITGVRKSESVRRAENAELVKVIGKPKTTQKFAEQIGADFRVTKQNGLVMNHDNDEARRLVEHCYRTQHTMLNPIIDWSNADVWEFLKHYGCESNPLYQCGYTRVGCVGCPMAGYKVMKSQLAKYPIYRSNYVRAFDRMVANIREKGRDTIWNDGEDVYNWWVDINPDQLTLIDYEKVGEYNAQD